MRRVVGVVTRESVLVGVAATVLGLIAGRIFLSWMLSSLVSRTVPDIGIEPHVSPATLLAALAVGVLAVALASLLLVNRIRRMNIPTPEGHGVRGMETRRFPHLDTAIRRPGEIGTIGTTTPATPDRMMDHEGGP